MPKVELEQGGKYNFLFAGKNGRPDGQNKGSAYTPSGQM
jgi:hypothetical protein